MLFGLATVGTAITVVAATERWWLYWHHPINLGDRISSSVPVDFGSGIYLIRNLWHLLGPAYFAADFVVAV